MIIYIDSDKLDELNNTLIEDIKMYVNSKLEKDTKVQLILHCNTKYLEALSKILKRKD